MIVNGSEVFMVTKPITRIGRHPENDFQLAGPHVSRFHAELIYSNGRFKIMDRDSTGGTLVNGEEVTEQVLSPGDVITLTNVHLVFGQENFPPKPGISPYTAPEEGQQVQETLTAHLDEPE